MDRRGPPSSSPTGRRKRKPRDERSPLANPNGLRRKLHGLPANEGRRSQMTTDRSPPGQARQQCSSGRCCSASPRQHPPKRRHHWRPVRGTPAALRVPPPRGEDGGAFTIIATSEKT